MSEVKINDSRQIEQAIFIVRCSGQTGQCKVTKTTNFSYLKDKKDAYYLRLLNYIQHGRLLRSPCILDPDIASEFFSFAHAIYISFGDFLDDLPCKMIYYSLDRE